MTSILKFQHMKNLSKKISMITCYDYWSAKIIDTTNVDAILVGDSASMVMHGHKNTTFATLDSMCAHVNAVARGAKQKIIIADMPFLSYRQGLSNATKCVLKMVQSGAQAIKLEGAEGNLELVSHIVESGIPVMGHVGLTPQSVNRFGGHKVQGKEEAKSDDIISSALALENAGCFALILECTPAKLAAMVTEKLRIPIIGIGAGPYVSGQVLVLQDMLGMDCEFSPKFVKTYLNGFELIKNAINDYDKDVKSEMFPKEEHSFGKL